MSYQKTFALILASTALLAAPAWALNNEPPSCSSDCEPEPTEKGDNGWGNGADTTNNGSFSGGTEDSKSTNGSSRNDKNYPSALDRFDGR